MKVVLSTWGKFHFFHLARQLERRGVLKKIFSTYPRFKLRDEGLPPEKVESDALIETFLLGKGRFGISTPFDRFLQHLKVDLHDRHIMRRLPQCDVFVALSGSGLVAGGAVQKRGGIYICERGSSHIAYGDDLMAEEFTRWGAEAPQTSPRFIAREEAEYAMADRIVVPSSFVKQSFIQRGVAADKIIVNGYGADLSRFQKKGSPPKDQFVVLFVGGVRFRKGIPYLLEAFKALRHPNKVLKIVGSVLPEMRDYLRTAPLENVEFMGIVPNTELPEIMSQAHAMVLPSIEEGMALVQAEALASGCPVIASRNTGGEDLFSDGSEGFIVPIRDPQSITDRLQQLADDPDLRDSMSEAGMSKIKNLGGWDLYGSKYMTIFDEALDRTY
ncbi:glycosyltransferase [Novosphingobium beihaiensis]|uniref:Glycosyltransferase n=1 Tax=Novosphingobium beihaiensis TaxID=2930389 RepID=A0ABT0BUH2_9SPHN|nr:glycosyltransferase [Novosphingobium beihaiensis]MCJ2188713.1 glycosyltransferase [Novosphingobium beihaiensis]